MPTGLRSVKFPFGSSSFLRSDQVCAYCSKGSEESFPNQWILSCHCCEDLGATLLNWTWCIPSGLNDVLRLSEGNTVVAFHPLGSLGTATVTGSMALFETIHYWELKALSPVYGTDVTIGVGLANSDLIYSTREYSSTIGSDNNSWGLSYRGSLVHNDRVEVVPSLAFNRGSIVGCLLDLWHGTLHFFVDGQTTLNQFQHLPRAGYYPLVCSTAALVGFRLIRAMQFPVSLQFLACRAVFQSVTSGALSHSAVCRCLPPLLKKQVMTELPWRLFFVHLETIAIKDSRDTDDPVSNPPAMPEHLFDSLPSEDPFLWTSFNKPDSTSSASFDQCSDIYADCDDVEELTE